MANKIDKETEIKKQISVLKDIKYALVNLINTYTTDILEEYSTFETIVTFFEKNIKKRPYVLNDENILYIENLEYDFDDFIIGVDLENIETIGQYAFSFCSNLLNVKIGKNLHEIGQGAFKGCLNLKKITIPFVGQYADGSGDYHFDYIFGGDEQHIPNSLKEVIITNCESIGNNAFMDCSSLTSITLPSTLTSIGSGVFAGCSSLTSIVIPEGVTSIESSTFSSCNSLESIVIPRGVTSIGWHAFYGCDKLIIYCEVDSQPAEWNSSWNPHNRPVYWAGEWEYDKYGNPKLKTSKGK